MPSFASGPGTSSTTSASSQRLRRPGRTFGEACSDLTTTPPPNPATTQAGVPQGPPRTPYTSFFAPAGLAVGFGPKELSPTRAREAWLAIHPEDLIDPCWVPRPPALPGGSASLAFCCYPLVYAAQRTLSTIGNTGARRPIQRSTWKVRHIRGCSSSPPSPKVDG